MHNLDNLSVHLISFECVVSRARSSIVERAMSCTRSLGMAGLQANTHVLRRMGPVPWHEDRI